VELNYEASGGGGPASVIVKLEPESGDFRDAEREIHAFQREIRFYREIANQLSIQVPRTFYGATGKNGSVLVMEDLSRFEVGDQVRGLSQEQVLATVRGVAPLHAAYWESEALKTLSWVPAHDHFWEKGVEEHWAGFSSLYGLRIGREALRLGERVFGDLRGLESRILKRPSSVIHGDLRADNLLFGRSESDPEVIILDWQLVTKTLPTFDLAYLFGGSEPAAERRGHQVEVLAAWHESLLQNGVADYPLEEAIEDLKLSVLYTLLVPVKAYSMVGDDTGARTGRLLDAIAERMFASVVELDAPGGAIL
jgi:thiamine kinase-like enzyme